MCECDGKKVKLLCIKHKNEGFEDGASLSTICIECDEIVNTTIIADRHRMSDIAVDHMHMSARLKPNLELVNISGDRNLAITARRSFIDAAKEADSGVIVEVSGYVN